MPSKISAAKVPLQGWVACIWVDAYKNWYPMMGSPFFQNPDDALLWAKNQL